MSIPDHDATAHAHLGFCAHCPGHSWASEAIGWRMIAERGPLGRWLYRRIKRVPG